MANPTSASFSVFLLLLLAAAANAGRPSPALDNADKKQKECFEGVVVGSNTAGFGGGGVPTREGSTTGAAGGIPSFTDLDHSGPAAAGGQYIPGFDDTFVPNPGYEIPSSSGAVSAP